MPGFLIKSRPDYARIFTKMSPDEELVTLPVLLSRLDKSGHARIFGHLWKIALVVIGELLPEYSVGPLQNFAFRTTGPRLL